MNKQASSKSLKINEIFFSIQGESSFAGRPCVFVRLSACNLRCSYCDTEYAFYEGKDHTLETIVEEVKGYDCKLVEITGGEPLLQKNVHNLMQQLCDLGLTVLLETGGHMPIVEVDPRVHRIMDLKCPSSGESDKMHWDNLSVLNKKDEVKFVVADQDDYQWATDIIRKNNLTTKCTVLISPVFGKMDNQQLAEWILEDQLDVRFQVQMHKMIWDPQTRGV